MPRNTGRRLFMAQWVLSAIGLSLVVWIVYAQFKREATPRAAHAPVTHFLIGETHLGPSQLRVARIFAHLLRTHDIDAIFLEQPDDLTYDPSPLSSLRSSADRTIAALQFRLIEDARWDLTAFFPIIEELSDQHPGEAEMVAALERRLGPERFAAFERARETSERYDKSEYMSAMDYMYAVLQLKGIAIPFHNLEQRRLREAFMTAMSMPSVRGIEDVRSQLNARDAYMVDKARVITSRKAYEQVVWIVGAHHLQNLKALLTAEGHTVHIAYDSLHGNAAPGDLKNDMMVLVKKDAFLRAAKAPPPPSFVVDADLIPSAGTSADSTETAAIVKPGLTAHLVKLNARLTHSAVFTVVDRVDDYAAYAGGPGDASGEPFYTGDDPSELIAIINRQLRSMKKTAAYIDLAGFSEERTDAFESTCRLQQRALNNGHNLEILPRAAVPAAVREAFFAPGRLDKTFAPRFDTMTEGPFKGLVRMTVQFLANVGGKVVKVTMIVFGEIDVLKDMYALLAADDSSLSVADRVAQAKSALKRRHGLSDEKLRIRLRDEIGRTIVVEWLGVPSESRWSWRS